MTSKYPKDEFDLAGDDMPVGMHRPEPSRWRNVIPFLVILVAVPLLAWSFSNLLISSTPTASQSGSDATISAQSDAVQSAPQSGAVPEPAPAPEPAPEPEPQPSADHAQSEPESLAAQVNHNASIAVLNGTGIDGLAGRKVEELQAAGFPGASAANADGWITEVSTIYYRDPQVEVTAREIGRMLGVENFKADPELDSNADIVVVLK